MVADPRALEETVGATAELAGFMSGLDASEIPGPVRHQAKRCLIDWLGVTLAGSADPAVEILCAAGEEFAPAPTVPGGGGRTATVLGRRRTAPPSLAALINGYAAHVLDFDDTYNPARTTVHGSAPVWPVVLALGEPDRVSGERALAAFVAGFETEIRVARAAGPAHYERGWHVTGTVGHFGAAAAAGRLLGLDSVRLAHALGAAGTQAAGLKGVYGSMGKALHPGKAAMDGILAALLARRGFTASESILEDRLGFLHVLSDDPDVALVTAGLGEEWALPDDGFKPYACGSLTHPTIEAVIGLREEHGIDPLLIASIEATVNDYVSWVTGKTDPATGLEGKFSIFHCAAVAAVDGAASVRQFEDGRVRAADVAAMRERVRIVVDEALPKDAASVTVILNDGRRLVRSVRHNKGTPGKPMTDQEIEAKFADLAAPHIGDDAARRVLELCWRLDACDDVGEIARLCAGVGR
ncbi:MAG: MmgE/PrpD family protein [Streptosporangiales bacterium]|nr:MmgE/PrpD family protein [Streptosporangiales bacterium]